MGGCEEEKECFYVAGNLALSIWAGLVPVCTCVWRIGVYVWARVSVVRNVAYVWARVSAVRMSLQAPVCMYAPCAMATMDSCLNSRRPFSLLGGALPAAGRVDWYGHLRWYGEVQVRDHISLSVRGSRHKVRLFAGDRGHRPPERGEGKEGMDACVWLRNRWTDRYPKP
jgi:hypothetical protein